MPQVDPKFTFWFGVWTNILMLVAGYGIEHAPPLVAQYAPSVQWFASLCAQTNSVILTALVGISSTKPGPLVNVPAITPTIVKILLVALALALFLPVAPGHAQGLPRAKPLTPLTGNLANDLGITKPAPTTATGLGGFDKAFSDLNSGVQSIVKDVVDKGIVDLTAAITDATNHNDAISLPCWNANLALLKSLPVEWETPPPMPIGIALGIQIQRDILNAITGDQPTSLKVACAALWGDQLKIVANVGALIGVRVATGGLL